MELTHEWLDLPDPTMPQVSDEELLRFVDSFTHIHRDADGDWREAIHARNVLKLRGTSCNWDPKLRRPWSFGPSVKTVPFYVTCGYYGFFKPTIAEVAAAVPAEGMERYNSFYISDHIGILKSGCRQLATAVFVHGWVHDPKETTWSE